nr:N-acetylmuramoyl-L-alanine amidase family protein [Candidatus Woesebacteria bacterium]
MWQSFLKHAGSIVLMFFLFFYSVAFCVNAALPGSHSATVSGDVFLGGDYIELGVSQYGSFGTDQSKPAGFYGTAARSQIGMSSDLDGFDNGTDWRMDFFMPGTQEERWSIGYKIGGSATTAANARRNSTTQITNNTVTNQSSGDLLQATSVGSYGSNLQITQVISFNKGDKFFKNEVTLENISGSNTLDNVRYMRSFDPDNTVDKSGSYTTRNAILYTFANGDGKAVVQADTSNTDADPVYT